MIAIHLQCYTLRYAEFYFETLKPRKHFSFINFKSTSGTQRSIEPQVPKQVFSSGTAPPALTR